MSYHTNPYSEEELKKAQRVARLITLFLQDKLTPAERDELDQWVGASDENIRLFEELTDEDKLGEAMAWMDEINQAHSMDAIRQRIHFAAPQEEEEEGKKRRKIPWTAIAASVAVLMVGSVVYLNRDQLKQNDWVQEKGPPAVPRVPAPGSKKAVLMVGANRYTLDSTAPTTIPVGQGQTASNQDQTLQYQPTQLREALAVNTLIVPAGGEYALVLADGTRVWLNAASQLTYPTTFPGTDRTVDLTGEAYFEVAKQSTPFIVRTHGTAVQVLGTHFNVEAYDSAAVKTTLLEGSVRLSRGNSGSQILQPGQQGITTATGIRVGRPTNILDVIAWKNARFAFHADSIRTVMDQVARWYQVTIVYEGKPAQAITGSIYRNSTLQEVLRMLTIAGGVHFTVKQDTITVRP